MRAGKHSPHGQPSRRRCAAAQSPNGTRTGGATVKVRIAGYDWHALIAELNDRGCAVLHNLLTAPECRELAALYGDERRFRSRIQMDRYGFGRGEYQYFNYPLPQLIAQLRTSLYRPLARIANDWNERLGVAQRYPCEHATFLRRCHDAGQTRPTPLLLRYMPGDFNCLHQDIYGAHVFALQSTVLLSKPGRDFSGGEFVLTEQRPRRQSRLEVVPLDQGDAVIFTVRERPVQGLRGVYRAKVRHGVSPVRSGVRHTLGIIFHDAS